MLSLLDTVTKSHNAQTETPEVTFPMHKTSGELMLWHQEKVCSSDKQDSCAAYNVTHTHTWT